MKLFILISFFILHLFLQNHKTVKSLSYTGHNVRPGYHICFSCDNKLCKLFSHCWRNTKTMAVKHKPRTIPGFHPLFQGMGRHLRKHPSSLPRSLRSWHWQDPGKYFMIPRQIQGAVLDEFTGVPLSLLYLSRPEEPPNTKEPCFV